MSALAKSFGDDPDRAREAWALVGEFSGGTAQELLRQSKGDFGALESLREDALAGRFNAVHCGSSLDSCPWVEELPEGKQAAILTIVRGE
jgi:hypothetical protein